MAACGSLWRGTNQRGNIIILAQCIISFHCNALAQAYKFVFELNKQTVELSWLIHRMSDSTMSCKIVVLCASAGVLGKVLDPNGCERGSARYVSYKYIVYISPFIN